MCAFLELAAGPGQSPRSHAGKENKVGLGGWGVGRLRLHLPREESREQCGSQGRCACCTRSGCGGVPPGNPARSLAGQPAHAELLFQLFLFLRIASDHGQYQASPKSTGRVPGTSHSRRVIEAKGP